MDDEGEYSYNSLFISQIYSRSCVSKLPFAAAEAHFVSHSSTHEDVFDELLLIKYQGAPLSAFAQFRLSAERSAIIARSNDEYEKVVEGEEQDDDDDDRSDNSTDNGWNPRPSNPLSDADGEEDLTSSVLSAPPAPFVSTWTPTKEAISAPDEGGWQTLAMCADMHVTFIGEYEFRVLSGCICIAEAYLTQSNRCYRVFAPSTHSLPAIHCLSSSGATLEIRQSELSMRDFSQLSPLFRKIWSPQDWPDHPTMHATSHRGFSYIANSEDDPMNRPLRQLVPMQSWRIAMQKIKAIETGRKNPITLVCGVPATGKSTLCRLMLNRMLTSPRLDQEDNFGSVCFLDLDPDQAEFTPCGQVSLVQIREPVFGPPYTHCHAHTSPAVRILRAHSVTSTSAKDNIEQFISCATDLLERFHSMSITKSLGPLIINTPGSTRGLALEVLLRIICVTKPDHIFYIGFPHDQSLGEIELAAGEQKSQLHNLQRHGPYMRSPTSAQLQEMQAQSYFHSMIEPHNGPSWGTWPINADKTTLLTFKFNTPNLNPEATSIKEQKINSQEWEVDDGLEVDGEILGIASLAGQLPTDQLATVIDSNILAAVVIEDPDTLQAVCSSFELAQPPSPAMPYLSSNKSFELLQATTTQLVGLVVVQEITASHLIVHSPNPGAMKKACATGHVILVHRNIAAPSWAYMESVYLGRSWRINDWADYEAESAMEEEEDEDEEAANQEPPRKRARTTESTDADVSSSGNTAAPEPDDTQSAQSPCQSIDKTMDTADIKWVSYGMQGTVQTDEDDIGSPHRLAQKLGRKTWRGVPRGTGV